MKSILIIIDYFGGKWPEWFFCFLESCRWNPTVNWLFHTDCPPVETSVPNVAFQHMTRQAYVDHVNKKLNIGFRSKNNYKLCDLRPMYGVIWEEDIHGFDFFGYGDLDVIYGDIRHFYTDDVLEYDVISTHEWCFSGHLCLIGNQEWLKNAYKEIPCWKSMLELEEPVRFDEDYFIDAFVRLYRHRSKNWESLIRSINRLNPFRRKHWKSLYLKEQYTTPLTPMRWIDGTYQHPKVWYWRDGKVTNNQNGERQFIYLHFMNYVRGRYLSHRYGCEAIWKKLDTYVHIKPPDIANGFQIDNEGIGPIKTSTIQDAR